jgi:hypothetical protein
MDETLADFNKQQTSIKFTIKKNNITPLIFWML